jgi:hypothetical protein
MNTHLHIVAKLKKRGAKLSLPQYVFMAWCLIKHRDNLHIAPDSSTSRDIMWKVTRNAGLEEIVKETTKMFKYSNETANALYNTLCSCFSCIVT